VTGRLAAPALRERWQSLGALLRPFAQPQASGAVGPGSIAPVGRHDCQTLAKATSSGQKVLEIDQKWTIARQTVLC
jgi:hypothetical protein